MAVKKACLNLEHKTESSVQFEDAIITRTYDVVNRIYSSDGIVTSTNSTLQFADNTISMADDTETLDDQGLPITGNKIIKSISKYTDSLYLITKRYVSEEAGLSFNKIYFYISSDTSEINATYCIFIDFTDPLTILNSSKLPYSDFYSYKLTLLQKQGDTYIPVFPTINNSDTAKFELVVPSDTQYLIRWNLTENTEATKLSVPINEFILQTDIQIDPADKKRTFIDSDPIEYRTYFYIKFQNIVFDSTITLKP